MYLRKDKPGLVLAPMEGVTDYPMRILLGELGGFDYAVSEFVRVSQDIPPAKVFHRIAPELQGRSAAVPVQVQILGGDPEKMALSALSAIAAGAEAIDINFGCPAPTVNRHDGGATLLKSPCRIREIVSAVRAAVPPEMPVSAKLRLGWEVPSDIFENARMAQEGGASWITIHGRTKAQGYAPPALWEPIGEVRKQLSIPVVANGDIRTYEDYRRCREVTGCDHFMIGRGALGDPYLASRIMGLSQETLDGDLSSWRALLLRFIELSIPHFDNEGYVARRIKQWAKLASITRPIPWFEELKRLERLEEIFEWLRASFEPPYERSSRGQLCSL